MCARPLLSSNEPFDVPMFLKGIAAPMQARTYSAGAAVYRQGAEAASVFFLLDGNVKLAVLSPSGKEAVVAMLGPGHFIGEGCLAGQPKRMSSATALVPSRLLRIGRKVMQDLLHQHPTFADHFLRHMLDRNIRIEEDLVDHLFNSSEKRLARTLLLLARYGKEDTTRVLPKLSQETLAEMIGTTRSRVNFFMNKFRRMGLLEYNGRIKVNSALLAVVLHE
jgi:CRP-like cAMP-binding protein